ncbi:MAG: D-cysteine desulfhydrase family protein [Tissierellia bacterium]|nr:D-cysteine desulfhydrase family protein [Tissierellia bacterium]
MNKINLANLPTRIVKLEKTSKRYNKNIYLKRDDFTGTEVSGNKVRKLEYAMAEALNNECDAIITTGALQSNHCRATAAVCAELGLECYLILMGEPNEIEGNLFLDYFLGANIYFENDVDSVSNKMETLFKDLKDKEKKPYIIPMGASNHIGTYGYINAYEEILKQEKDMNIEFDLISTPVGSGGTYGGLWYGDYINNKNKRILGFAVSETKEYFKETIVNILRELDKDIESFDTIEINDLYVGQGYGIATDDELEFYLEIGKNEGVIFDPCYTGKGFRGLLREIEKGNIKEENILFIHTGGLMGWTKEYIDRAYEIGKIKSRV